MRIFCITNNKGGVAKTTSTVNIAYALAEKGNKVLVIDADPQCNASYALSGKIEFGQSLFEVLQDGTPLLAAIQPTKHANLSFVPSSINLSAADLLLASAHGRERRLERALQPVKEQYDYILIDTPPQLGILTINALVASTDVIIPISLTTFALVGISVLDNTIQSLRANLDLTIPIFGVLATVNDNTPISNSTLNAIKAKYGDKLFNTSIPKNNAVEYAHNVSQSVFEYEPGSKAAIAYGELTDEIVERAGNGK